MLEHVSTTKKAKKLRQPVEITSLSSHEIWKIKIHTTATLKTMFSSWNSFCSKAPKQPTEKIEIEFTEPSKVKLNLRRVTHVTGMYVFQFINELYAVVGVDVSWVVL